MNLIVPVVTVVGSYVIGYRIRSHWCAPIIFFVGCVLLVAVVRPSASSPDGSGNAGALFTVLVILPSTIACVIGADRGRRRASAAAEDLPPE